MTKIAIWIGNCLFKVLLQSSSFAEYISKIDKIQNQLTPAKLVNAKDQNLFFFEEKGLTIRYQISGDKDKATFHVSIPHEIYDLCGILDFIYPKISKVGAIEISQEDFDKLKPFIEALYETKLVKKVNARPYDFFIEKAGTANWHEAKMVIMEAIASCYPNVKKEAADPHPHLAGPAI